MALFSTFSQVVTTASPYPADRNTNTNASRAKPYGSATRGSPITPR